MLEPSIYSNQPIMGLKSPKRTPIGLNEGRVRSTNWADGLRGIASIFVVSSHFTLCFARYTIPPSASETETRLFQRPFFRLVGQGQAWVAIFFVLLGFVNSLKHLKLARTGETTESLRTLAESAFRRTGRLVFPATVVTISVWLLCQLGAFQIASRSDAWWMRTTSPAPSPSVIDAIQDLIRQLISTWAYGANEYDQPQWALSSLLKGSFAVFMTLLATINTTPSFRILAEAVLYFWSWAAGDALIGMNVYAGMILAELSFQPPQLRSPLLRLVPYGLVILGFYLCSFPSEYYNQATWSAELAAIGANIFPSIPLPMAEMSRYWAAVGAQMVCLGISLSPSLRNLFSSSCLLRLGALSYPIYLLHGPLMRSLFAYMLYLPAAFSFVPRFLQNGTPDPESYIPGPSFLRLCLTTPVFAVLLLFAARLWVERVQPYLDAAVNRFEIFSCAWGDTLLPISHVSDNNKMALVRHRDVGGHYAGDLNPLSLPQ